MEIWKVNYRIGKTSAFKIIRMLTKGKFISEE
jgi:hypothetical protein